MSLSWPCRNVIDDVAGVRPFADATPARATSTRHAGIQRRAMPDRIRAPAVARARSTWAISRSARAARAARAGEAFCHGGDQRRPRDQRLLLAPGQLLDRVLEAERAALAAAAPDQHDLERA